MQVTVEKLNPVLVEFHVEVPADLVRTEIDRAYADLQRTARVRGFRPGKAPRQILAHIYGGRVHADVAQRLIDSTLDRALADKQVQPLSRPDIAPSELKPEAVFSYKARFEVRPDIESVKWEGFEVKRPAGTVNDAAVDAEIERLRREHSTLHTPEPERPAKAGDTATLAFSLEIDGKEREGGTQDIETEIGTGQIFKELEDALTGMSVGDKKDVSVPFPDRHQNVEFRGKTGIFHVTLKDLKERKLPDLDDEFAKDCGPYENLAALKEFVKGKLEKDDKQKQSDALAEQLVVELCKANPIPVPPSLVEQQAKMTEQELFQTARRSGQRLDITDEIRHRVRLDSEVKVRAGLLMAEIAKVKQIAIVEADIEKGYEELAEQTGKNVAKVKAEYRDQKKREMLIGMILEDKILNMLEAAAKITDA
jgi:trigger factor